jgi:nitrogen regulatory protein P-II 1
MKLVQCVVQPAKLETLVERLQTIVTGMTVSEARGFGRQRGRPMTYRGTEYRNNLLPKAMLEVAIDDNKVDDVVKIIIETARTGQVGDGRVFVLPLGETYHVRTGFIDRE